MIACPACKRRTLGPGEILGANLDGRAKCPSCGEPARLDQMSRCMVACVLALLLWFMLWRGNLFYSGNLFLFSTLVILAGWPLLAAAALPLLTLERATEGAALTRPQSLAIIAIMIVVAVAIDGLMSYRSDADRAAIAAPGHVEVRPK